MTKLTGRHMEFELSTLSFDEYLGMKGFLGKLECDFICRRHDDYSYVQVAMTIAALSRAEPLS